MKKHLLAFIGAVSLFVISTVGTFVFIEYGGRWVFGRYPSDYNPDRFMEKSEQFGWLHKPESSGYWYLYSDGTRNIVTINSSGFSDDEFPEKIDDASFRIAIIGDSVAQAWEVRKEDRFTELLRDRIKSLSDVKVEILNFGIRGFGTDQELLLLKNFVVEYSPEIILLFFCLNDLDDIGTRVGKPFYTLTGNDLQLHNHPVRDEMISQRGFSRDDPLKYLREHSWVAELIYKRSKFVRKIDNAYIRQPLKPGRQQGPRLVMNKEIYNSSKEVDEIWMLYERLLREFKSISDSHGIELVVIANPSIRTLRQIQDVDYFRPFRKLDQISTRLNIDYISMPDIFLEMDVSTKDIFHREDWWHYNETGNKLLAEVLWEYLGPKINNFSEEGQKLLIH